ncbi:hypothetical protein WQ54_04640 [Bacillus sp. SA1-12]|uniref:cell wall hydrolase n=1 Tax=Bacillus sp. SA1-12 TaxID=1455638 RepID=UPI000626A7F2|nr:cell wall hydrolase [Bacillus sp. SA1-12]KKI93153.1 hypothetical protein WQ54_04640 [Bacillus sp. SA1-12]
MNITYMKTLVVVCVVTFLFIVLKDSKAEAFNQIREDSPWIIEQQYSLSTDDLNHVNNLHNYWINIKKMMEMPDETEVLAAQTSNPVIEMPDEMEVLTAQSSKTGVKMPDKMEVLAAQPSNPVMEVQDETEVLAAQPSNPVMEVQDKTEVLTAQPSNPVMEVQDKIEVIAKQTSKSENEKKEPEQKQPAVTLSNEEKDLFARLVEAEAKGESYEGKVAVAIVVLNRVESPNFPNTVTEVINQVVGGTYAFSPVQNGEISKPASAESRRAVDDALTSKDHLNNSIYFYNPDIATDNWIRTRDIVKTIGHHVFAK